MSGYVSAQLSILCLNIIIAYAIFLPAASGQLNLGAGGFAINLEVVGGAAGFPVDGHADILILAPITLGVVVFCWYLMSTRFGLAMRSVHDDENVATLFGINVRWVRVAAFTLGGLLGGLYGALYGHQYNYIEVQNWNVLFNIYVLLYVLLGGTQTPYGPLIGALFFTFVPEMLRALGEALNSDLIADGRFALFGVLIVLMMVFRPEGIVTRTLIERVFGRKSALSES